MDAELTLLQAELCRKYGSPIVATPSRHKVGIAHGVGKVPGIINGLRHPVTSETAGWYFWPDQELSDDEDFFQPYHAFHLLEPAGPRRGQIPFFGSRLAVPN